MAEPVGEPAPGPVETGTYLYAIGPATGGEPRAALSGVLGTRVRAVAAEPKAETDAKAKAEAEEAAANRPELVAYVSTVPLSDFGEAALRRNLEDLVWLETIARAHHQVLTDLLESGPVLPVRLVTVYRGDDQVREMVRDRAGEFADLLADMSGRKEWGVKVYAVGQGTPAAGAPDDGEPGAAAPSGGRAGEATERPGTAYLKRRGRSLRGREAAQRRAMDRARQIDAVLSRIAVAARHHRAQDPQLSGRADLMVLNGAYLVDDGRADEFAAAAAALREDDLEVQITGPWPPYSFTISDSESGPEPGRDPGGPR